MQRRRVIAATGLAATAGLGSLAGCSGDGDGSDADGGDGADGGADSGGQADGGGQPTTIDDALSVTSSDTEDVDEPTTIVMDLTVESDAGETRTGVVVGEIDVDGESFSASRQVTVDGGGTLETALKIGYESASSFVTYTATARIEDEQVGEPDDPVETGAAEDLVVVDLDHDSVDAPRTIELTAEVRNLVDASRRGELVGEVDLSDGPAFSDSVRIRVDSGATTTETVRVEYESESAVVTYSPRAHVE